jgi:pimeloyl-ACP methyl ester carboxylesterase
MKRSIAWLLTAGVVMKTTKTSNPRAVGGAAWSRRRRSARNWTVLGLLIPLAAACDGENDPQAEQSVDPSPTASISEAVGTVQTNSGGSVHYRCAGEGDPTILMEAGGGAGTDEFAALLDPLAEKNRVCTYDRPGTGMSPDVPNHRRTLDDLCQVQDEVIEALAIAGPYVLLGQSFGGNIVIGCAERHPDRVAGLEVVEGYHDDPQQMRKWARDEGWTWQGNPEHVDGVDISDELDVLDMPIGSFPVLVLSATDADPGNVHNQKHWLGLSPDSRQVVVEGGHDLHFENPEEVVHETLTLLRG